MEYFASFTEMLIVEIIPDDEISEFIIMLMMLYNRFCSNFNYNILPLDNIIYTIDWAVIHLIDVVREEGIGHTIKNTFIYDFAKDLTLKLGTVFFLIIINYYQTLLLLGL
ncbi:Hypothetical protein SRAE_X000014500 [Strongyloides ratti]|uniref:Uncharacterized protein n=1 Tax=Strongyloides ratti TaxID=34506 RepID=A0A090LLW3_STRRB|nr:Hypothetical protein SRAE_X000014500 [Strongyloides ratti]CEF70815.1 Hypothetical protein SRAE_X000014500 [Strongyloides ratti]